MTSPSPMPSIIGYGMLTGDYSISFDDLATKLGLPSEIDAACVLSAVADGTCKAGDDYQQFTNRPNLFTPGGKLVIAQEQFDNLKRFLDQIGFGYTIDAGGSTGNSLYGIAALLKDQLGFAGMMSFSGNGDTSQISRDSLQSVNITPIPAKLNDPSMERYPQVSFIVNYQNDRCSASYPGIPFDHMPPTIWDELDVAQGPRETEHFSQDEQAQVLKAEYFALNGAVANKWKTPIAFTKARDMAIAAGSDVIFFLPKAKYIGNNGGIFQETIAEHASYICGNDEELMAVYGHPPALFEATYDHAFQDGLKNGMTEEEATEHAEAKYTTHYETTFQQTVKQMQRAMQARPIKEGEQEPIAFITRGDYGSVIVTKDRILDIPMILSEAKEIKRIGAGDATAFGFLAYQMACRAEGLDGLSTDNLSKSGLMGAKMGQLVVEHEPARLPADHHDQALAYRQTLQAMDSKALEQEMGDIKTRHCAFLEAHRPVALDVMRATDAQLCQCHDEAATKTTEKHTI